MTAYLDDFGKIVVWMDKNFYGGRSEFFTLLSEGGFLKELVVSGVEDHGAQMRYELIAPAGLRFGVDYYIREQHGLRSPLVFRMIVRTKQFHDRFTYTGNDLGATYTKTHTDFALWSPTAVDVIVRVKNGKTKQAYEMERTEKGVWRVRVQGDLQNATYVYLIKRNGAVVESKDPYAYSSTGNGMESAVINLERISSIKSCTLPDAPMNPVDAIIYETSVRDITSSHLTGTKQHSTYAALCEENTSYKDIPTGLSYLASLGVTHVQLLPVLDYATVDEFHPKLLYNWGYDAMQFMTLEGSYSSDADNPYARMMEFKKLVSTLHKHDMRVVLDIVFNHLYDVDSSSLNCTVPYYYFRYNDRGYLSNGSFCGNDLDSEQPMMRKLMLHALKKLVEIYDVDGFRFDLMGILDVDTMNLFQKELKKMKKCIMLYGEGWNMPTFLDDAKKASIANQGKMPGIGHFNDYYRDVIKGKTSDDQKYEQGYLTGDIGAAFSTLAALSGNTLSNPHFRRFDSPNQSINALETHDNSTVWDKMHACCGNESRDVRRARQKMMLLTVLISQGVPFIHAGQEFCGTKNDNSNSYNAGDSINQMDWERAYYNRDIIEYTKKCIALRKKYKAFRLSSTKEISEHVRLNETDGGIIFYDISFIDKETHTKMVRVLINPTYDERTYDFGSEWKVIFDATGDELEPSSVVHVPGLTVIVAVQQEEG